MKYFVWVPGLHGPEAQIWDEENKTREGKPIKTLIAPIAVENYNLDALKKAYPFEAKS